MRSRKNREDGEGESRKRGNETEEGIKDEKEEEKEEEWEEPKSMEKEKQMFSLDKYFVLSTSFSFSKLEFRLDNCVGVGK